MVERVLLAMCALLLCSAAVALRDARSTRSSAASSPARVLVLGDSISTPGLWQAELKGLLAAQGTDSEIHTEAVGGTTCSYWVDKVARLVAAYSPDLVVLVCGTNDDPQSRTFGEPTTGWALRSIVETVHASRPTKPIPVLPALVQYSDPLIAPQWLWAWAEPRTNDLLWTNMQWYRLPWTAGWLAGVIDLQQIPSTATYLGPDGIHPTVRAQRVIARLVYDEAAPTMGWPTLSTPRPCDLYGHRVGYTRPAYVACPEP